MNRLKKIFLTIVSTLILLCFSASCFGVVIVPVIEPVEGLPGYTLSEAKVSETKGALQSAKNQIIKNGTSDATAVTLWNEFIYAYYEVATQANVAYVHYAADTSSNTNKENYLFASSAYNDIYAEYMVALQDIYKSEKSKGISGTNSFFNGMDADDLNRILKYSKTVVSLENEVTELQVKYGELLTKKESYDEQGSFTQECLTESTGIYKQIIEKNNKIAVEYGFSNYYDYASEYIYGRDYDSSKIELFRINVGKELPSLVTALKDELETAAENLSDGDVDLIKDIGTKAYNKTTTNYWQEYVSSYDSSNIKVALTHAFDNKNVMFADGQNASASAFTVNLPYYEKSYCYFGPGYQDAFTVAHEIGHYYAGMYQGLGSASMDLNEVHSQGNEMLLLEFLGDKLSQNVFKGLELSKLSGILSTVIVSTMIDEFEYFVYTNDVSQYTYENFDAKMNEICANYGGVEFVNSLTDINHYWRLVVAEHPVYYISYATSGVAALNLYVATDSSRLAGRKIYSTIVENDAAELGFAGSLMSAGLTSPFSKDAFSKISTFVKGKASSVPGESESESRSESASENDSASESESSSYESASESAEESSLAA